MAEFRRLEWVSWCMRAHFPGKPEFIFGTVGAATKEDAMQRLSALADKIFPHRPEFRLLVSGRLVFEAAGIGEAVIGTGTDE